MKLISATAAIGGVLLLTFGAAGVSPRADAASPSSETGPIPDLRVVAVSSERAAPDGADLTGVVQAYCAGCHNDRRMTGNLSLSDFDVAHAAEEAPTAEKMIVKLRAGMMPPPGARRPAGDTLQALVEMLEATVDRAAAGRPTPGRRTFQRLNRSEYARSILDLLDLEIDAGDYLPLDTKSENFDNISEAQLLSPTLLDAYLNAASEISRLAMGDVDATAAERVYAVSGYVSQMERVEGAPFGTRGGVSVVHNFPADAEYVFRIVFEHTTTGEGFFGAIARGETVEVSVDGEPVATLEVDRWMTIGDPDGISMHTDPVRVPAGPHRVTAAFLKRFEGPVEDLLSPHDWSLADRHTGINGYGLTALPHLKELGIGGPFDATGVSETPSRRRIFSCRPATPAEARACAREIVERLAVEAYRRPVDARDVEGLMAFYDDGAAEGGFETGVRKALQALLSSPHFIFRLEATPADVAPGQAYPLDGLALASRLSFFLWGSPPDDRLVALASEGRLSDVEVLRAEARRMLDDPRSEALAKRFAAQWLRLQDLYKVRPDPNFYPNLDENLADAMHRETELFFNSLVREDRGMLDLFTADYTFVNERLADHYGIEGVVGRSFRKVEYPDAARRGILGHGSVLTLTSHANRTSPVLRGKWIMEVLLGTPPPPPPPGVPDLEETEGAADGRELTTGERMALHRAAPTCNSCHQYIDPIGLALDNFDVTGKWRIRENGMPLDTRGELYDGSPVENPADLREALLSRPTPLIRTFTQNLMAYALGRRVEYFDQPTVRAIGRRAAEEDLAMSAFILGVVESDAFRMKAAPAAVEDDDPQR
ncbi:MAG: DUF1592 domain-containing protein [Gemmatimonadetes bacterium]|nr:DUF1592 domain-containing protein [Gemmatimonadota bacterium]